MSIHHINRGLVGHAYGPIRIALIGCGGTGSQMLTGLARLHHALRAWGHSHGLQVRVYDPDVVTPANVARQMFCEADIGLHKSIVLTHRVNQSFGLRWEGWPGEFQADRVQWGAPQYTDQIVITCVDSARARREIFWALEQSGSMMPLYWLDCGNLLRSGQVVLGEIFSQVDRYAYADNPEKAPPLQPRLPHVFDLFPELLDESYPEDDTPSCSLVEALARQSLFVNQAMATFALTLLEQLLHEGQITEHGAFINLRPARVNPILVPAPITTTTERRANGSRTRKKREAAAAQ